MPPRSAARNSDRYLEVEVRTRSRRVRASGGRTAGALVALALVSLPAVAAQQQEPPRFETTVEVVQMQVAVADSRGVPVMGLTRDDFRLRIDGRPRDLVAVYEVDLRRSAVADAGTGIPEASEDYIPPAGWRQWLLFFDFSFNSPWGTIRARDAAIDFVQRVVHPRDLVAVATYSTITGLKLLSPFTADRGQVLEALQSVGLEAAPLRTDPAGFSLVSAYSEFLTEQAAALNADDPFAEITSASEARSQLTQDILLGELQAKVLDASRVDLQRYGTEVTRYVSNLGGLGEVLTATRGRKHVVLFSQGFDDKVLTGQTLDELEQDSLSVLTGESFMVDSEARFGNVDLRDELRKSLEDLLEADAVLHAIDTSGLAGDPSSDTYLSKGTGREALNYLSDETNGTIYWNRSDLTPALVELESSTSQYYVLAYRKQPADPGVVSVDVDVARPGARVVAAPQRMAPPPAYADMSETQRQMQMAEYIAKGIDEEDLTFDIRASAYRGVRAVNRLPVVVEIPFQQLQQLGELRGDGQVDLDILGYVLDSENKMRDVFGTTVHLDLARLSQRGPLPFRYYNMLWAIPGEHQVRVLLREQKVGRLSTRTEKMDVPSYTDAGLVVSDLVSIDGEHPGLLMRGIDPASPPDHKRGGPIAYPFIVGGNELTPMVYTTVKPGGSCYFLVAAQGLGKSPATGEPELGLSAVARDELGNTHTIERVGIVMGNVDAETDTTQLLLEAPLPAGMPAGAYLLEFEMTDGVTGARVSRRLPFLVTGSEVTAR